ncbi:hypothetical protein B0H14DRAFT_2355442, partial [Mycena olivaceomarginata]
SPLTCGNPRDAVPLYYAELNGFYTTSVNNVNSVVSLQGYTFHGIAAHIFSTQELSTVPFWHLFNPVIINNLFTISTTERNTVLATGYVNGSTNTFIYPTQSCGSIPFYHLYQPATSEHLYTILSAERDAILAMGATGGGWEDQGIAGYVLDLNPCA